MKHINALDVACLRCWPDRMAYEAHVYTGEIDNSSGYESREVVAIEVSRDDFFRLQNEIDALRR